MRRAGLYLLPALLTRAINAKLETAAEKPMFRHAFRKKSVLVPVSGFYEWVSAGDHKQAYFIRPAEPDALFGFGGLLEH